MAEQILARRELHATVVGGPTTVLDYGGLRIVSDATFDPPGGHGYLTKTEGPALAAAQLGAVDLVLVSHDDHPDNLDSAGRAFAVSPLPAAGARLAPATRARLVATGAACVARSADEAGAAAAHIAATRQSAAPAARIPDFTRTVISVSPIRKV